MRHITAPWTDKQVAFLNEWQTSGRVHPFTCGECRDRLHVEGVMEARPDGWHCPTHDPQSDNPVQLWAWELE